MSMSFDVIMIKSFSSSGAKPANQIPAEKKYVSTSGKPLSEASVEKAKALSDAIQKMGPFAGVFSSESTSSQQTLQHVTNQPVTVSKAFNQINLGIFEGKKPPEIQQAYAEAHPDAAFIPEANDCLNTSWPTLKDDAFETYEEVDMRVLEAFQQLSLNTKQDSPLFVVSTAKEPVRSVMLHSTLGKSLQKSKFYKALVTHIQREPSSNQPIREFAVRGQLNPNDGSWMRFRCEKGKITLVEVSDDVEFRKAPPVPGYFK